MISPALAPCTPLLSIRHANAAGRVAAHGAEPQRSAPAADALPVQAAHSRPAGRPPNRAPRGMAPTGPGRMKASIRSREARGIGSLRAGVALSYRRPDRQYSAVARLRWLPGYGLRSTLVDRTRSITAVISRPDSGVFAVTAGGVLCAFAWAVNALSEQCLRRRARAKPLFGAAFRTRWLLSARCAVTCHRRRRPGQARRRQGDFR